MHERLRAVACVGSPRHNHEIDRTLSHPFTNRLIDALPPQERAEILALMQPVALPLRSELFDVGQIPRYVHLITSGQASVVAALSGGQMVEVGLIGRDGLPEALHLLGPQCGDSR